MLSHLSPGCLLTFNIEYIIPYNTASLTLNTLTLTRLPLTLMYSHCSLYTLSKVEMSLHFSTLLSARLTWDSRVKELLDDIKRKIKETVGYMAENMRDDLMNREFRKVRLTIATHRDHSIPWESQ